MKLLQQWVCRKRRALFNFTQTAACDLGADNIRVNAVCPGLIETGMTKPVFDYARQSGKEHKLGSRCELRRYGKPEEIACTILFLASGESSYITGQALTVDGGNSAALNLPGMKVYRVSHQLAAQYVVTHPQKSNNPMNLEFLLDPLSKSEFLSLTSVFRLPNSFYGGCSSAG